MAKNQNSAEKRRREVEKKFKAEEKRKNRTKKKYTDTVGPTPVAATTNETETPAADAKLPERPARPARPERPAAVARTGPLRPLGTLSSRIKRPNATTDKTEDSV